MFWSLLTPLLAVAPLVWGAPQQLNTGTVVDGGERAPFSSDPRVGIAANGAALVAYAVGENVWIAAAAPGAGFGPPRKLMSGESEPELAVQPDGTAIVTAGTGTEAQGVYATGNVDGTFGAVRPLPEPGLVTAVYPVPGRFVAIDQTRGSRVLEFDTGGELVNSAGRDVSADRDRVGIGTDGTLAFPSYANGKAAVTVRTPDGRWRTHRFRSSELDDPHATVAPDGRVGLVAVRPRLTGEAARYGRVVAAELGTHGFGRVRTAPVHPAKHPAAFAPGIAYDVKGRRVVTWIEDPSPNPGAENEVARGRVIAWAGGRRALLDGGAASATLVRAGQGVLVASDGGLWRTTLITGDSVTPLSGPDGRPFGHATLASAGVRTVFAWRGLPDGGIRAAFAMPG